MAKKKEVSAPPELFKNCPSFLSLSLQHQKFVLEYLKDFNATRAAKAAKYSIKTAHSQGPRLLENVEIQKALGEVSAELMKGDIADAQEISVHNRRNIHRLSQRCYILQITPAPILARLE